MFETNYQLQFAFSFKTPVFILLFSLISFFCSAQILNIEKLRLEKDTAQSFKFKATAGLNMYNRSAAADDPVNLFGYNLDFNSIYYPKEHAYLFLGKFDYLKINDNDFLNFGFLHGRVNFLRAKSINYETFVQYSYDNFRGLDPRWITGGAIRFRFIENDQISLVLSTGAMYEYEKWKIPNSDQFVEANFIKSTNYLSFRATINEFIDLNTVNYYQTGYDNEINQFRNRVSSTTVLNSKLTSRLSWTNTFDISYEDKPIVDITKLIFSFRTGISFDL